MPQVITVVVEAPATGSCILIQQPTRQDGGGSLQALFKTVGREVEALRRFLEELYDSAFVETEGDSPLTLVVTVLELEREPRVLAQQVGRRGVARAEPAQLDRD